MEKRIHTIPLRRKFLKAPRWRRTNRAVNAIKEYVEKHYRTTNVIIGKYLNEHVWSRGSTNPPSKVRVVAIKDGDKVSLELEAKYVEPVKKETLKEKVVSKVPLKKGARKKEVKEPTEKKEVKKKAGTKKKVKKPAKEGKKTTKK